MSVVAYRWGVLAADSRAYGGHGHPSPGFKRKLHRLADGSRVGVVSAKLGEPERFLAWLRKGRKPEEWTGGKPDIRALLVEPGGRVFLFEDSVWPSGPISPAEFYAIGSGQEYAIGAMAAGASAPEAVQIAIRFDPHCGGPVAVEPPESMNGADR